jgi:hypothetical protein
MRKGSVLGFNGSGCGGSGSGTLIYIFVTNFRDPGFAIYIFLGLELN